MEVIDSINGLVNQLSDMKVDLEKGITDASGSSGKPILHNLETNGSKNVEEVNLDPKIVQALNHLGKPHEGGQVDHIQT